MSEPTDQELIESIRKTLWGDEGSRVSQIRNLCDRLEAANKRIGELRDVSVDNILELRDRINSLQSKLDKAVAALESLLNMCNITGTGWTRTEQTAKDTLSSIRESENDGREKSGE